MGVITLEQAAQWCGGRIDPKYKDVTFLGANNDTRKLEAGQLFIALKGERDGHDFIPMAMEKGAAVIVLALSFFSGAKVYPPSRSGRFWSCFMTLTVPASKSTQSHVRPSASPSRNPVNRISL